MKLSEDVDADTLVRRLQAVTLAGIQFLGAVRLRDDDRALGRVLSAANYAAILPAELPAAAVPAAIARLQGLEPLAVMRPGSDEKGRAKLGRTGRRPQVAAGRPAGVAGGDGRAGARAGSDRQPVLTFSVAISTEGSARPLEVVEALFGPRHRRGRQLRAPVAVGAGPRRAAVDPLDLAALRARTVSGQRSAISGQQERSGALELTADR